MTSPQRATAGGVPLQRLVLRLNDEVRFATQRIMKYRAKGHHDALRYTDGQVDAFNAMILWAQQEMTGQPCWDKGNRAPKPTPAVAAVLAQAVMLAIIGDDNRVRTAHLEAALKAQNR
jgi:hypothetical protein